MKRLEKIGEKLENNSVGFYHEPVMAGETIEALNIKENGIYVDGTTGGGGHSELIADALAGGRLICVDRDEDALKYARERLSGRESVTFVKDNFKNLSDIIKTLKIDAIDGILLDLGVSSYQLDCAERGFSYMKDAPLDMRMDRADEPSESGSVSAKEVINGYSAERLVEIFFTYGEERFAKRIASHIVKAREKKSIDTTLELVEIIDKAIPASAKQKGSHCAKKVFQAVRIEVNDELSGLREFVKALPSSMNSGGRIAVITFHSLEDKIIKQTFNQMQNPCICPPDFPVCGCGMKSEGFVLHKKPVIADGAEALRNPRAKSAKLRVFEKR